MKKSTKERLDNIDSNMADMMAAVFYGTIITFWILITFQLFRNFRGNEEE